MNLLMIAFDPHRVAGLPALRALIESSFPFCWHRLECAYMVRTPLSSTELRAVLKPALGENDELLVVMLSSGGWAWSANTDAGVDWLRRHA